MVFDGIACFIHRASNESVPDDEVQFHQQLDGIVESCTTHPEVLCRKVCTQLFEREMAPHAVHGIKNGKALRRFSMLSAFEIRREHTPHCLPCFIVHYFVFSSNTAQRYTFLINKRVKPIKKITFA
jgi:hypothetical protein